MGKESVIGIKKKKEKGIMSEEERVTPLSIQISRLMHQALLGQQPPTCDFSNSSH